MLFHYHKWKDSQTHTFLVSHQSLVTQKCEQYFLSTISLRPLTGCRKIYKMHPRNVSRNRAKWFFIEIIATVIQNRLRKFRSYFNLPQNSRSKCIRWINIGAEYCVKATLIPTVVTLRPKWIYQFLWFHQYYLIFIDIHSSRPIISALMLNLIEIVFTLLKYHK